MKKHYKMRLFKIQMRNLLRDRLKKSLNDHLNYFIILTILKTPYIDLQMGFSTRIIRNGFGSPGH